MRLPDPLKQLFAQDPAILLAMCIWGEARGEGTAAKLGVACVVRNRVNLRRYGSGYSGVILKPYQFSCFLENDPNRAKLLEPTKHETPAVWQECLGIADAVMRGALDMTQGATHYFDDSMIRNPPSWAAKMRPTVKFGRLNFYREG